MAKLLKKRKIFVILNKLCFCSCNIHIYIYIYILATYIHTYIYIYIYTKDSSEQDNRGENDIAEVIDGKLKGKFVSQNLINLSKRLRISLPKVKDAAIELSLSRLEEEIMANDTKLLYSNFNKEERLALNSLRNDTSIIIKKADKGSGVVVWDRGDFFFF